MESSELGNNGATSSVVLNDEDNLMDFEETPTPSVNGLIKRFENGGDNSETPSRSSISEDKVGAPSQNPSTDPKDNDATTTTTSVGRNGPSECKKDESEEEFYYISEDELDETEKEHGMRKQYSHNNGPSKRSSAPTPYSPSSHSSHSPTNTYSATRFPSSSTTPMGNSYASVTSPPSRPTATKPTLPGPSSNLSKHNIPSMRELSELGRFVEIDPDSDTGRLISLYAKNGIPSSKLVVKVEKVYEKEKEKPKSSMFQSATKRFGFGKTPPKNGLVMMLWCKTTSESIKKLAQSRNSCTAFYDRICRALPLPMEEIKGNFRQRVLLCKVELGDNMYKSPHGWTRWSIEINPPIGYDSVKGMGLFRPNWHQNKEIEKGVLIPCGETEKDNRFPKFDLEFNEYLVYQSKQIEVQFAVDIEISPK